MERNARDENAGKGGSLRTLFDDLSLPQVAAGALAAVTSMLLASQIGIYGSVIGVGVAHRFGGGVATVQEVLTAGRKSCAS